MKLSIFIVNYNGAAFIAACIDSIFESKVNFDYEVIVFDNASSDNSKEVLQPYADKVKLMFSDENFGFSRGNNEAYKESTGTHVFLLNNDTVLQEDTLQLLMDYYLKHPEVGAITPKLLNEDGTVQCPGSIFGHWRFKSKKPIAVPFIAGAAVIMSREVYDAIGGLDDNLFFYNDDIDMCKMLLKKGYEIHYVPTAELTHFGGLSTKFRKIGTLIEGYRGGFYVCYKHYGPVVFTLYRLLVFVDILPRLSVHVILSLFKKSHWQYVKAYVKIININLKKDIFLRSDHA